MVGKAALEMPALQAFHHVGNGISKEAGRGGASSSLWSSTGV